MNIVPFVVCSPHRNDDNCFYCCRCRSMVARKCIAYLHIHSICAARHGHGHFESMGFNMSRQKSACSINNENCSAVSGYCYYCWCAGWKGANASYVHLTKQSKNEKLFFFPSPTRGSEVAHAAGHNAHLLGIIVIYFISLLCVVLGPRMRRHTF